MKTIFTIYLLLFGSLVIHAQDNGNSDYTNGFIAYFKKDYATAINLYKSAINKGNAKAMIAMGDLYRKGEGVAKNQEEAKKWYEKGHQRYVVLAQAGDAKADAELADLYYKGDKIEKNFDKALKYYLPKAVGGNASYMVRVAHIYEFGGFGTTKDLKKAAEWYLKADEYGQNVSGALQRIGVSAPKKLPAEEIYTTMMAEANSKADPSEHRALAMKLYVKQLKAENVPTASINQKAKEKLQKMAAIDFYATFRSMLGLVDIPVNELNTLFTPQQQAVMKDLAKSVTNKTPYPSSAPAKGQPWSARGNTATYASANTAKQANTAPTKPNNPISSPQANTVSTTNTAIKTTSSITSATDNGSGDYAKGAQAYTQKNFTEAFKWFKIAADKGNVKAAAILGAMCYNGEGVSKNETEGFKWYKLAAEGDYLEAKHNVGLFYAAGKGVQANYHEARKWLKEAAKEGYSKSPEILWELDKNIFALMLMSPSQLHDWEGSNGKLGYKDKASGSVWIPAKYEDGGLISEVEQLAPAKLNGKWGFIDLYDKTVIPFQYEDAEPLSFIEGLAAVKQNGKWGFIDKSGKTIIPFQYDKVELGCFVNGYAKVIQNGKTLFIHNPLDKVSTTTKSTAAATTQTKPSSNSNASLAQLPLTPFEGTNGKYGYKDQSGKVIVEPIYDFAYEFSEGLAGVHVLGNRFGTGYGRSIRSGYLNTRGEEVIPLAYTNVRKFTGGLAWVNTGGHFIDSPFSKQFTGGQWGLIDKTGKEIIPPKYSVVTDFSEGLAAVNVGGHPLTGGGLWGFVDTTGKEIIPVKYEAGIRFPQFAEGLVALKLNGKYGFVDKTGKEVIPFQYELAESFKDGKAKVFLTKGGLPFYIDKTGTQID